MGLGARPKKGGRFGRSPFSRPECTECGKTTSYGSPQIRVEISLPGPDMNKMIDQALLCSTLCLRLYAEKVKVES